MNSNEERPLPQIDGGNEGFKKMEVVRLDDDGDPCENAEKEGDESAFFVKNPAECEAKRFGANLRQENNGDSVAFPDVPKNRDKHLEEMFSQFLTEMQERNDLGMTVKNEVAHRLGKMSSFVFPGRYDFGEFLISARCDIGVSDDGQARVRYGAQFVSNDNPLVESVYCIDGETEDEILAKLEEEIDKTIEKLHFEKIKPLLKSCEKFRKFLESVKDFRFRRESYLPEVGADQTENGIIDYGKLESEETETPDFSKAKKDLEKIIDNVNRIGSPEDLVDRLKGVLEELSERSSETANELGQEIDEEL